MTVINEITVKLDRAKEHLDLLDREIQAFLESNAYKFTHDFESEGGPSYVLVSRIRIHREIPLRFSAILGDGFYNVRSALDHLVYQLSLNYVGLNGDLKGTEFPIFDGSDEYSRVDKRGRPSRISGLYKVRSIAPQAQTIIEGLQPYHGGDNTILCHIRDLCNIDKHRYFHVVPVPLGDWQMGAPSSSGVAPFSVPGVTVKRVEVSPPPFGDGAVVVRTYMTIPDGFDFKVRVHHKIPGEIVLDEWGVSNAYASIILAGCIGFVRRKVVPSLSDFL